MIRRNFLTTSALAATGLLACTPKKAETAEVAETGTLSDPLVQKAINVLLCNQRMAWEQGTASQALISVGKKDLAILFARDAVVRQNSEGRLGIVANDPGVTDPASNGEAVLLAYKETGDEKYKKAADGMF